MLKIVTVDDHKKQQVKLNLFDFLKNKYNRFELSTGQDWRRIAQSSRSDCKCCESRTTTTATSIYVFFFENAFCVKIEFRFFFSKEDDDEIATEDAESASHVAKKEVRISYLLKCYLNNFIKGEEHHHAKAHHPVEDEVLKFHNLFQFCF